jgi:seryl-tRNA synthetase
MLDIRFVRENFKEIEKAAKDKGIDLNIKELLDIDKKRVTLIEEVDSLRSQKKSKSKPTSDEIKKIKEVKNLLSQKEAELREIEESFHQLMLRVPNIPDPTAPIGGEENNKEIFRWGDVPTFKYELKDHISLAKDLDLIDIEAGVKVSGFRGYYLKNEAVMLQLSLMLYGLEKLTKLGFTPMIPPTIVKEFALIGSGHFPAGKDEIYQIKNTGKNEVGESIKESLYLVGTSEPSLLAYYSDQIIDPAKFPIKLCGFSQCYRSEVGSYGKDTRGVYRIHEFMKIEQVVFVKADLDESIKWHNKLKDIAQEYLQDLGLPYRVLQIATGDMGAGKYAQYDIETWMPSRNNYGETHSDSNLTDWQTRRLNIRYKDSGGAILHPYALNNTMIASPRILIALLENFQQPDGSIKIPECLHKYTGFKEIKRK